MTEFFVVAHTFAAPFVSEEINRYVEAPSPGAALEALAAAHADDFLSIYAADAHASADDYHRHRPPLASWRSNKALAVEGARSIRSDGPGEVEIDGRPVTITDPKGGRLVAPRGKQSTEEEQ